MFILKELWQNGTVTMDIHLIGIESETFFDAIKILKMRLDQLPNKVEIYQEDLDALKYRVADIVGILENKPLNIIDPTGKLIDKSY